MSCIDGRIDRLEELFGKVKKVFDLVPSGVECWTNSICEKRHHNDRHIELCSRAWLDSLSLDIELYIVISIA